MRSDALAQCPYNKVELDDGSQERCCGRELEPLQDDPLASDALSSMI